MKIIKNVIECYGCGTFIDISNANSKIKCPTCHSIIDIKNHSKEALAYAISALLLFISLYNLPLLTTNINGITLYATLLETPLKLYHEGFIFVAFLIFFTIILAPLLNSLIIIFTFFYTPKQSKNFIFKLYHITKDWGFIDIFMIGCVIAYIKMDKTFKATHFDTGFYIMIAYLVLFYLSNINFDEKMILKGKK